MNKGEWKATLACVVALTLGLFVSSLVGCRGRTEVRVQNPVDRIDLHLQPPVSKAPKKTLEGHHTEEGGYIHPFGGGSLR